MSSSKNLAYSHNRRTDYMEKDKEKDSMERGHVPVPPLVEGEKPVNPVIWNLMIVCGVLIYGSYTILIHLCEADGKLPFSSASMVLVTEVVKLVISVNFFLYENHNEPWTLPSFRMALPFAVPAVLYCINNNLGIHLQLQMDPATYQVLSNLKILSTAILYRLIIKRPVSWIQWIALSLLALAGGCNSYGGLMASPDESSAGVIHITWLGVGMISVYCTISGMAGVFTEYILKGKYETSIHMQNSMLYIFGIILNGSIWILGTARGDESWNLFKGYNAYAWVLIFSQAIIGLIMSAVMKHASNIARLFLISCAMLVTTFLSVLIFHLHLNIFFCAAFFLVFIALYLYHKT